VEPPLAAMTGTESARTPLEQDETRAERSVESDGDGVAAEPCAALSRL